MAASPGPSRSTPPSPHSASPDALADSRPASGSMLSVFFKVWSFVKVSAKAGHNPAKTRKLALASEAAKPADKHFKYISGRQLLSHSQSGNLLLDERHFRPAAGAGQPTFRSRHSVQQAPAEQQYASAALNPQTTCSSGISTSGSGASTTSGSGQRARPSAGESAGQISLTAAGRDERDPRRLNWTSKLRRSATSVAFGASKQPAGSAREFRRAKTAVAASGAHDSKRIQNMDSADLGIVLDTNMSSSSSSDSEPAVERQPEVAPEVGAALLGGRQTSRPSDANTLGGSSCDIYSTPNDSVHSVASMREPGAPVVGPNQPRGAPPVRAAMVKSFSANYLSAAARGLPAHANLSSFAPIVESPCRESRAAPSDALATRGSVRNKQLAANRFFISSSSSEDSGQQPPAGQPVEQQPQRNLRLERGFHIVRPSGVVRPDSLLLTQDGVVAGALGQPPIAAAKPSLLSPFCWPPQTHLATPVQPLLGVARGYRKSPSLFDMAAGAQLASRGPLPDPSATQRPDEHLRQYKLASMLLEFGANPARSVKDDESGCTALQLAVLADNLEAARCLLERAADPNEPNRAGSTALELACESCHQAAPASLSTRLELAKLLLDAGADVDREHPRDASRLLDRLIAKARTCRPAGLSALEAFIELVLNRGAKIGTSTWRAARGQPRIQVRLVRKLCQDGYFLYQREAVEAAVYRFEYALYRTQELERDLAACEPEHQAPFVGAVQIWPASALSSDHASAAQLQELKYQLYLGLSRCERKRKFLKRALEFAHMAILVDSTAYEAYYSKAHILKDSGEIAESKAAIEQTSRIVAKAIEQLTCKQEQARLRAQSWLFEFGAGLELDGERRRDLALDLERQRAELDGERDYLAEARRYVDQLRAEIDSCRDQSATQM